MRDVFEIVAPKAARFMPRWGIALDFVPHVKGDSIGWHRTDKTAQIHVVYDPADFDEDWWTNWSLRTLGSTLEELEREAARILPEAVNRALVWYETFGPDNLAQRIEEHRKAERHGGRFKFENFGQQPLALAFALARAGRPQEATEELSSWAATGGGRCSEKTLAKLRALMAHQQ